MDQLDELFEKYRNHTCTPEELEALLDYFANGQNEDRLKILIEAAFNREVEIDAVLKAETNEVYAALRKKIQTEEPVHKRVWSPGRWAVAASILFLASVGGYWWLHSAQPAQLVAAKQDVAPFSKQAILKTGHGKALLLDSNQKGTLAKYANTNIQKSGNEQIAYTNNNEATAAIVFDTLQVPAGGKPYHLKLADGSQVMVNVASALRFPENFRKNNNEVELIAGEAYFSIIHNAASPLIIKAKGQTIEDIGTEFNVNTYNDEPDSRTTLVDGAVKVNKKDLVPGEQAIITANGLTIAKANIAQTIAWVKGDFIFKGENIRQVMRELARWYDIEVKYEGQPSNVGYYLNIARSKKISEVLNALERTKNVHFKIEGRRVTVLSKK